MNVFQKIFASCIASPRWFIAVTSRAAYRFYWDDLFSRAAALAYASLFALVPVLALSFSIFSVFGLDHEQLSLTLRTVIEQVLPPIQNSQLQQLQAQVIDLLQQFTENVRALNTLSIAALVFTSIALFNTIESALNVIWRVTSNLSMVAKLMSFWTVITLGPLPVAVSIYWATRVRALSVDYEASALYLFLVTYIVPISVTWFALSFLFYKLPSARVRITDALFGALLSAILFEFVKRGFAYYVGLSSTYSTIYGVLASIPLFLFWLYVAWIVVLFGAEVSYQAGSIHVISGLRRYATELGEVGALLGLQVLLYIGRRFKDGSPPPSETEIAIATGSDPVLVRTCLNVLSEANFISVADPELHTRALIIQPDRLQLNHILAVFRSKEHRKQVTSEDTNGDRGDSLLEAIRRTALALKNDKAIMEWNLEDLLVYRG